MRQTMWWTRELTGWMRVEIALRPWMAKRLLSLPFGASILTTWPPVTWEKAGSRRWVRRKRGACLRSFLVSQMPLTTTYCSAACTSVVLSKLGPSGVFLKSSQAWFTATKTVTLLAVLYSSRAHGSFTTYELSSCICGVDARTAARLEVSVGL